MDVAFEISKKLNNLNLQAALKRQDKDTGLIYFDEKNPFHLATKKVPFIENLAYVLALFNHKNLDGFHAGEKMLEKLLFFYKEGNFPKYIHDFPIYESPYTGIYAYPYLFQILKNFKPYLKAEIYEKVKSIAFAIQSTSHALATYHHLEPLVSAIQQKPIKELFYSFESAYALVVSCHDLLPSVLRSQEIKFTENGHCMLSLFDFLKAQNQASYPGHLLNDHPLHLKLSLFYEPFEKRCIALDFFEPSLFPIGFRWIDNKEFEHVMTFDDNAEVSILDGVYEISGNLELHQEFGVYFPMMMTVLQNDKKGTYFLKNEPIYVSGFTKTFKVTSSKNLAFEYQKRKQELFQSSCLVLKNQTSGSFHIRIEQI